MASYDPPTQNLPVFDVNNFIPEDDEPITRGEADKLYVRNTNGVISNTLSVGNTIQSGGSVSSTGGMTVGTDLNVGTIIYSGNRKNDYPYGPNSGQIRRRRNYNLVDTSSAIKIARFNPTDNPLLEFEQWDEDWAPSPTPELKDLKNQWIINAGNNFTIRSVVNNYVTAQIDPVVISTTALTINVPVNAMSMNGNIDMNGYQITDIDVPATTARAYPAVRWDNTTKTLYSKAAARGMFTYETVGTIAIAQTGTTAFTKPTFTNAISATGCNIGSPTSRIVLTVTGMYRITISPNIKGSGAHTIDFWLLRNGNNVAGSGSRLTAKNGSDLPFVEFIYVFAANEYIEFGFVSSATDTVLECIAAGTNPDRPLTPAIIVTVQLLD